LYAVLEKQGTCQAIKRLRRILNDTNEDMTVRITAAESLVMMRDCKSRSSIERVMKSCGDSLYVHAFAKAIRTIDEPGWNEPLFSIQGRAIRYHFTLDQVKRMVIGKFILGRESKERYQFIHEFDSSLYPSILNRLQGFSEPEVRCAMIISSALIVELHDGRRAVMNINENTITYQDHSRWWHGTHFMKDIPGLTVYLWEQVRQERGESHYPDGE